MKFFITSSVVLGCCLLFFMLKEAFSNRVVKQTLTFKDLPACFEGMSIFFISDIHRRVISKKILDEITGKVDFIIIGGDLAERGVPIRRINNNLQQLTNIAPVFFVWGNNDYEINTQSLLEIFQQYDVRALDNCSKIFTATSGEKLALMGVKERQFEQIYHENERIEDERLQTALKDAQDAHFKILISHKPDIIEQVLPEHNIQLILCGHTHGGQIHILGYSPYERGTTKKIGKTTVLISNGYGTTGVPLRLGAKVETHLLRLSRC